MCNAVLPGGGTVFFFKQPVEVTGVIVSYPGDDLFYGNTCGCQQMDGMNQPFTLQISRKGVRGIFFHQTADKIGRLSRHFGIFFQSGRTVMFVYVSHGVHDNFLLVGRRGTHRHFIGQIGQLKKQCAHCCLENQLCVRSLFVKRQDHVFQKVFRFRMILEMIMEIFHLGAAVVHGAHEISFQDGVVFQHIDGILEKFRKYLKMHGDVVVPAALMEWVTPGFKIKMSSVCKSN